MQLGRPHNDPTADIFSHLSLHNTAETNTNTQKQKYRERTNQNVDTNILKEKPMFFVVAKCEKRRKEAQSAESFLCSTFSLFFHWQWLLTFRHFTEFSLTPQTFHWQLPLTFRYFTEFSLTFQTFHWQWPLTFGNFTEFSLTFQTFHWQ